VFKASKRAKPRLTFEQACIAAEFSDFAADLPNATFAQITRRLLGRKGFPKTPAGEHWKRECRKVFEFERHKGDE
jgi:hypothetical protein